jgi:hypothetical protein
MTTMIGNKLSRFVCVVCCCRCRFRRRRRRLAVAKQDEQK